jgi:hypothetical protein
MSGWPLASNYWQNPNDGNDSWFVYFIKDSNDKI